ncbi:pantoate--beta-alanine ligase [Mangrovimonas sp. YM274]|uniref:pantoate--beta-alanine ligase n=1 Tax=Mangrovimonas sp. YM274 TaxID=3070660 RepID=UPI0027DDD4D8|nr:pantoate--beta-alanine ligase [Mangrovimonas sp. YM274]WMI69245.1 pantoate--beta-alanine ligase [Mangrovimonas sp. YM274]
MRIYYKSSELKSTVEELKSQGRSIGLVPTMGALHQGHLSLTKQAMDENDAVVVSIFVNPTQFNNPEDLEKYPRMLETDVECLKELSEDIMVFAPSVEDIYGTEVTSTAFSYDGLEHEMEGRFRNGHFDGVGTIVKRLFEIGQPDKAYFGEKDFQQLMIIKKLVEKYEIPVNVIGCPIYREADGLAMSSRNIRLTPAHREAAPFIYKTLQTAKKKFGTESAKAVTEWVENEFASNELLELEYFIIADEQTLKTITEKTNTNSYRGFIAVYAGDVRLIDNIALN